jgi:hypothetical protein
VVLPDIAEDERPTPGVFLNLCRRLGVEDVEWDCLKKTPTTPCTLVQATSAPDPAPDTQEEEKGTPWPPEVAVEGGQVKG